MLAKHTTQDCALAQWSRMAIGRSTPRSASSSTQSTPPILASSGQEWQFHIATVIAYLGR